MTIHPSWLPDAVLLLKEEYWEGFELRTKYEEEPDEPGRDRTQPDPCGCRHAATSIHTPHVDRITAQFQYLRPA